MQGEYVFASPTNSPTSRQIVSLFIIHTFYRGFHGKYATYAHFRHLFFLLNSPTIVLQGAFSEEICRSVLVFAMFCLIAVLGGKFLSPHENEPHSSDLEEYKWKRYSKKLKRQSGQQHLRKQKTGTIFERHEGRITIQRKKFQHLMAFKWSLNIERHAIVCSTYKT